MLVVLLLSCGDKSEPDSAAPADDSGEAEAITYVDCEEPLAGIGWGSSAPVETGWTDGMLDDIDTSELPAQIDLSEMLDLYKGAVSYALGEPVGDTLDRDAVAAQEPMGPVVLAALAAGQDDVLGIDFDLLRQGLWRYSTCSTGLPTTLEGFKAEVFDYPAAASDDVPSKAKCDTRRLYVDDEAGVYVAETVVVADDGSEEIRETEVILSKHRDDGQLTFVVYGPDGQITDRSSFPTVNGGEAVTAASPYVCMACHLDTDTWTYDVLFPSVGPCAR